MSKRPISPNPARRAIPVTLNVNILREIISQNAVVEESILEELTRKTCLPYDERGGWKNMETRANHPQFQSGVGANAAQGDERSWRLKAHIEDFRFAITNPDVALALLGQDLFSPMEEGVYVGRVAGLQLEWRVLPMETSPGAWSVLLTVSMRSLPRRVVRRLDLRAHLEESGLEVCAKIRPISGPEKALWLRPTRTLWLDALFALVERVAEAAERLSGISSEAKIPALADPERQARLREHLQTRGVLSRAMGVGMERAAGWMSVLELEDHVVVRFQANLPRPRRGQETLPVDRVGVEKLAHAFRRLAEAGNAFTTVRGEDERRTLGRDLHARLTRLGRRLYELYVPKETHGYLTSLLDAHPRSPLVLETEGRLRALPWELLHNGDDFLSLLLPMARTPVRAAEGRRERLSIRRVLLVVPESDLGEALDEVRAIHRALSRGDLALNVEVLSGREATKEKLLRALQEGRFDAFHFSGHSGCEEPAGASYLRLGAGRKLRADELRRVAGESGLQLVFLNSCESATPASTRGDDVVGLADAFAGHGVPCVVGMRWPVSDRGARILALTFYRSLAERGEPALALREARLAVGSELDWEDPAWAAPLLYLA
jgi:hypothetical protein